MTMQVPTNANTMAGERQYEQHALQHLVALSNTSEQPSIRYYAYEGQGEVRSGAH
jgi:hypothetical protein